MVPATFTSSLFIGTDSFLAELVSFLVLAPDSPPLSRASATVGTPRPFFNLGKRTKVVITYARMGISTTMMMSGIQALAPPEGAGAAAAAADSDGAVSSDDSVDSVRFAAIVD